MGKMAERFNEICIRILQLVYLNLLWMAFSLLGLVLLGIGPATLAMFTVIRHWIRGKKDIPIFSTFWKAYRENFIESAMLGILYFAVGVVLYVDLLFVESFILRTFIIIVSFIYLVSLCYIFPIMAHYDLKNVVHKLKYSVLFGISYLQYTLLLLVSLAIVYLVLFLNPGIFTFFGTSIGCYVVMWFTHQVFLRIEMQNMKKQSHQVHS